MLFNIFNKTRQRHKLIAQMHSLLAGQPTLYQLDDLMRDAVTPLRAYGQRNLEEGAAIRQVLLDLPSYLNGQYGDVTKTAQAIFSLDRTLCFDAPVTSTDAAIADGILLQGVRAELEERSRPFFADAFSKATTGDISGWLNKWEKFGGCSNVICDEFLNYNESLPIHEQLRAYDLITTRGSTDQCELAISKVRALMPTIQSEHPLNRASMMLKAQELCLRTWNADLKKEFTQKILHNTL